MLRSTHALVAAATISVGCAPTTSITGASAPVGFTGPLFWPPPPSTTGFAVSTRLERIGDDGSVVPSIERWLSDDPEAPPLRWLEGARAMTFPRGGRYRVFLIAVTPLPIHEGNRAMRWDETTLMEGAGSPSTIPFARRLGSHQSLAILVYEYVARRSGEGTFALDTRIPALTHLEMAGLSSLL